MEIYKETKRIFKTAAKEIFKKNSGREIDEAAIPSYAHNNPLIEYIFWKRIKIAYLYAKKNIKKGGKILDFGCGTGLLSYILAKGSFRVTANDIEFGPLNLVKEKIRFQDNIEFIEGDLIKQNLKENTFDLIIALDVLEHIDNLKDYISLFQRILKPGGIILVSGPTENFLYKVGRKLAGKRFTGNYHMNNISNIRREFSLYMPVKTISKIVWPFTLFEVFIAANLSKS